MSPVSTKNFEEPKNHDLRLLFGSEYAIFDAIFWEVMRMEVNVLHIRLGFARKTAENMLFSAYLTGTESALR